MRSLNARINRWARSRPIAFGLALYGAGCGAYLLMWGLHFTHTPLVSKLMFAFVLPADPALVGWASARR